MIWEKLPIHLIWPSLGVKEKIHKKYSNIIVDYRKISWYDVKIMELYIERILVPFSNWIPPN